MIRRRRLHPVEPVEDRDIAKLVGGIQIVNCRERFYLTLISRINVSSVSPVDNVCYTLDPPRSVVSPCHARELRVLRLRHRAEVVIVLSGRREPTGVSRRGRVSLSVAIILPVRKRIGVTEARLMV